jgi:glycosyltransferase involved in cell wall biosynthesis
MGIPAAGKKMHIPPTKKTPIFSIILPTRDRAAMLRRAVSSVCRQSFPDFELIIVDDGSAECHAADLPSDPRIRIIRNSVSLGAAQARNIGIEAAQGTYISFLDDDDEYKSSFLSRTYASLKDTPEEIGISWCGAKFIHYPRQVGEAPCVRVSRFGPHKNRHALLVDFLSVGTGHGVTIKEACLAKVGPFNAALKVASDTDMFFRILGEGFLPLAVPGVHIVRHDHRGPRLTGADLYQERIRIWEEWLLIQHSDFLDQHPVIRKNLLGYVNSLKQSLADVGSSRQATHTSAARHDSLLSRFPTVRGWLALADLPRRILRQLQIDRLGAK